MPHTPEPAARSSTRTGVPSVTQREVFGEHRRRGIARGEDIHDELLEEVGAVTFLIDRACRLTGGDDFIQLQPLRDELTAGVAEDAALKAGLGADQKGGTFWRERVSLAIPGEKVQADQCVHDASEAALGGPGCCCCLLQGLGASVQHVEDAMLYRGLENQRRDKAPGELHDSFRRDWRSSAHRCLLLSKCGFRVQSRNRDSNPRGCALSEPYGQFGDKKVAGISAGLSILARKKL